MASSLRSRMRTLAALTRSSFRGYDDYDYEAIEPAAFVPLGHAMEKPRVNLVVPTLEKRSVFGGVSTALDLLDRFSLLGYDTRVVCTKSIIDPVDRCSKYAMQNCDDASVVHAAMTSLGDARRISVGADDWFICTLWTTYAVFCGAKEFAQRTFGVHRPLIYMIQDFEPGFYEWSSNYMFAEQTYRDPETIAVINSHELCAYLHAAGYAFKSEYCFEPHLNKALRAKLDADYSKQKIVLCYGRPRTPRNCFPTIVGALRILLEEHPEAREWQFLSAGATFSDVTLAEGVVLRAVGKLSLEDYADLLRRTSVGLSLMCSPHPSYPPLEMATFGAWTVTNRFESKDLSAYSPYILSVDGGSIISVADAVCDAMCKYEPRLRVQVNDSYVNGDGELDEIAAVIAREHF